MKDSRQIYRMTYLVRLPAYRKGDFFSYENVFYIIQSLHEQKTRGIDLATWDEKAIDGKNILPSRIFGGQELIREMIVVSQTTNDIQLMDPKTYLTIEIRKPKPVSVVTQMIKTVKLDDQLFLIPE
jgi:nonsense-mediated mRNA decay protein 3